MTRGTSSKVRANRNSDASVDRLLAVRESASMPPLEAVDVLAPESLPGFIGYAEALKVRALARLLASSANVGRSASEHGDRYLTVPEVADMLSLKAQYVYDMIRCGDLPAIEIGAKRYKRIRQTDLCAWTAQHQVDVPEYLTYSRH